MKAQYGDTIVHDGSVKQNETNIFARTERSHVIERLSPQACYDWEFALLKGEIVPQVGFPSLLVPRCEFEIEVAYEICGGHSKFYR